MRLYEEYLARHNLEKLPLAHHCSCASMVVKIESLAQWSNLLDQNISIKMPNHAIIHIKWDHNDHHPGQYYINCLYPKHDGYNTDCLFQIHPIVNVKWHEYEGYILSHFTKRLHGIKPYKGFLPTTMAAWEMFVYSCDGWFNKQGGDIKYLLFESLDKDNDLEKRWDYCQEILKKIQYMHSSVARCWKYDVCSKINSNAEWLADLIEEKCTRTILQLG
jgi:hypothetical protein